MREMTGRGAGRVPFRLGGCLVPSAKGIEPVHSIDDTIGGFVHGDVRARTPSVRTAWTRVRMVKTRPSAPPLHEQPAILSQILGSPCRV